ncbi:hypothetical protein [Chroococcidiopsis sp. CCMEE 29]|uniref:hypothetical protein n=1 Tax=Chroococcidiopsis sp. CCMEE 29 TaxID=155894 RepID=UPI002021F6AF|nr:hypothetical protein [Chroococcidiopsis sp. CCMEE 29]
MSHSRSSINRTLQIFAIVLGITLVVWLLRGIGILTFIPGGIIWLLILMAIAIGIFGLLQRRWRRL